MFADATHFSDIKISQLSVSHITRVKSIIEKFKKNKIVTIQ